MKYIGAFLSIIFLLVLSVNVFAQEVEQDSDVPKEITLEELIELEQKNTDPSVSLTEEEKGKIPLCSLESVTGMVEINVSNEITEVIAGSVLTLQGEISNKTNTPISSGTLFAKVLKHTENELEPIVVDRFVVQEDIFVPANSSSPISFSWNIPSIAESGDYQISTYLYTDNRIDVAGVYQSNSVSGGVFDFSIIGESDAVSFDSSSLTVNGQSYAFGSAPVIVPDSGEILILAPVSNTTSEDQNTKIQWKIYKWDARDPQNLIKTVYSDATILANSTYTYQLQSFESEFPVYHIVGELSNRDGKSLIEIRYVREGVPAIQVFSSVVSSYPLVKGEKNSVSSCVYNLGTQQVTRDGKVLVEIKNSKGKVVESHTYEGLLTRDLISVAKDFTSTKNLNSFYVHTKVWSGDVLSDEFVKKYDCKVMDPENCQSDMWLNILYTLGAIILIVILLLVAIKIKINKNITLPLFIFLIPLFLFTNVSMTEAAKSTSVSSSATTMSTSGYQWWLKSTLGGARISASYSADVRNADTNAVIADGASVPVGTRLKFIASNGGASWSASSPWASGGGSFISGAGQPTGCTGYYTNTLDIFKSSSNAWSQTSSYSHIAREYVNASVNPPSTTISKSGSLSCGGISGGVMICTVTGAGAIGATFNFVGTYGKLYRSLYHQYYNITGGVNGCYDNATYSPQVSLGAASLSYNFTATPVTPVNNPPNAPTITGPTTGQPSTAYTFGFRATDPDGNTVRYGVSWDNDNTVDEWIPASGRVNSNTIRNGDKTWAATGAKTFKARTEDQHGALSGWASHTITLSNPAINGSCGTTNNSCLVGTSVDLTDNAVNYLWRCNGSNGGTNDSCTLPKPVTGICNLAAVNGCSSGTLNDTADTGIAYNWRCVGANGGLSNSCTLPKTVAPVSYTLTFNGNGATSGSTASQSIASGSSVALRANGFARTGYSFAGWATSAGGAVAYGNQASYTMGSANATLYAKWNSTPPTGPTFTVSCSASPNPVVFPTTNTTFTAQTTAVSPTYRWESSTGTVLGSGSTLSRTYGTGQDTIHNINLYVTKGTETNSASCSVQVRCNGTHYEGKEVAPCDVSGQQNYYTCTSSGWSVVGPRACTPPVGEPVATFTFAPDIVANASGKCGLTMSASNVSSCTLVSPNGNISVPVTANSVSLTNWKNVSIGRYTLSCTGVGPGAVTKSFGVKSCIVNPDFREN